MDDSARAETLALLDALLRRPGQVFTDEWKGYVPKHDPPAISTYWLVVPSDHSVNAHLETADDWLRAWDGMVGKAAFHD